MNKNPTLTIGIPAYNEQANIQALLRSLLGQEKRGFVLEKILVISDGSRDKTAKLAQAIHDPRIQIVDGATRKGKPQRMNEIFAKTESDIAVILDADISILSQRFLLHLLKPMLADDKVMLASGSAKPFAPQTFIQTIIYTGTQVWDNARALSKSQMYYCEGSVRAFRKLLYKRLIFPSKAADDVYPYLVCAKQGYTFAWAKQAVVYYKLPLTYADFVRQSVRFKDSRNVQEQNFGKDFIKRYYDIGLVIKLRSLVKQIGKNPLRVGFYLFFSLAVGLSSKQKHLRKGSLWDTAISTKDLPLAYKVIFSSYDSIHNPYYAGGGATAIHQVAKGMNASFQTMVIAGKHPHYQDGFIDGVYYKHIGTSFLGAKFGQLFYSLFLPFYAMSTNFDVWIESFTPPFSTGFLPLFTKKPVIALVHMLSSEYMEKKYKLPFHLVENIGLTYYSNFIVLTQSMKEKILAKNSTAHIQVIENGCNSISLSSFANRKQKNITFIGRVDVDQKGLDLLLHAFALIKDKTQAQLVIAGNGSTKELKRLNKLVHLLDLGGRVRLLGGINDEQKKQVFSESLLAVVPSRTETFSLAALEAIASGVPLIVFNIEGLTWLPSESCIKVEPFDYQSLAQSMLEVVSDKKLRQHLTKNARYVKRKYSWQNVAKDYQLYCMNIIKHYGN